MTVKQLKRLAATLAAIAFIPGSAPAALADTEASASASAR